MRMYDGPAIVTMLSALFDEAVAPIGILGVHDEREVLEAALALQVPAEQVVVLVLRRHAHAFFRLDLRVEGARADAQVHWGTWLGEQLPRILRDEDPALADIFGAEAVTVGATRNAHSVALFSHIAGPVWGCGRYCSKAPKLALGSSKKRIKCTTGTSIPAARNPAATCRMQPGVADTTMSGRAARIAATFCRWSSAATSGCVRL